MHKITITTIHHRQKGTLVVLFLLISSLSSHHLRGASAFSLLVPRIVTTRTTREATQQHKPQQRDAFASFPTSSRTTFAATNSKWHRSFQPLYNSKYSAGTTPEGVPSSVEIPSLPQIRQRQQPPFSTTLLGTVLRKLFSPIAYLQRCIFRATTKATAAFLTAVISEPNCNQAFATVIMRGCNMVLTSNKLKERLVAAQTTLSQTEPSLAKLTGEDFFKVLIQFVFGLVDPSFEYAPPSPNSNNNNDV